MGSGQDKSQKLRAQTCSEGWRVGDPEICRLDWRRVARSVSIFFSVPHLKEEENDKAHGAAEDTESTSFLVRGAGDDGDHSPGHPVHRDPQRILTQSHVVTSRNLRHPPQLIKKKQHLDV